MITPQAARRLTRYNAWANKLIFDAVAGLPGDEATKERQSLFKNMVHTLNHNYVIDLIWQAHLEGREHGFAARNTPGHPPLDELWRKQQAVDEWYIAWSDRLRTTMIPAPLATKSIASGLSFTSTMVDQACSERVPAWVVTRAAGVSSISKG